jgi:hypothetical protein
LTIPPLPKPGTVVGYAFLWSHEADEGREEGVKDRPCTVLLTITNLPGGPRVAVLPITSSPPVDAADAFAIPAFTRARLGLQDAPCWVVISEANLFKWPGPDLRRLRRNDETGFVMGELPADLFRAILKAARERSKVGRMRVVTRSE